ncbi:response regulator [Trichlorobacter ammonificans]|uniref:Transcriptional regulatory protein KdpE n=1 Tax=Trichlorobacter ammonificans TaxID=2916410 RepID=A0ABM9D6M8_9BACT|nr:response regulator transcription factor [Trichlorobacter ammonificans]CAH2030887.1 Transcriptional regulatory protein KdpE [Trichlorobacter ammonificans]
MAPDKNLTTPARILVVDDEVTIQKFLRSILSAEGFTIQVADCGTAALSAAALFKPDLILLDLGLPDMDGVEVIGRLREWSGVPIIVLSVREREDDKVLALDAGADDYLSKPFGMAELLARIRVALRRVVQVAQPMFKTGELEVDLAGRRVTLCGSDLALTPTEYDILRLLVTHAGKVVTHNHLLKELWGEAYVDQPQVLRVNISNLRHKIEPDPSRPRYIITEPGVGYKLRTLDSLPQ